MFTKLINAVKSVTGKTRSIDFIHLMTDLIGFLPGIIKDFKAIFVSKEQLTWQQKQEIVDSELEYFDEATGDDGMSLIPGMGKTTQEQTLDHFKEMMRNILYAQAGVPGYTDKQVKI